MPMTAKQNLFKYLIGIAGLLALLVYIGIESFKKSDADIYLAASRCFWEGGDPYLATYFDSYHFFYSLLFTVITGPFLFLPVPVFKMFILLIDTFFLFRLALLFRYFLKPQSLEAGLKYWFWTFLFLFAIRFILDNYHTSQMTIFLVYASVESIYQFIKGRTKRGAFLLALAINIKLLPGVLLVYLIYRRWFREAGWVAAFYVLLLLIPILFTGPVRYSGLMKSWWELINPVRTGNVIDVDERSFSSLTSLLPTLLMEKVPDPHAMPLKRNILDLSYGTVEMVINISRVSLTLLALLFLRSLPFRKPMDNRHLFWELSYILLIIPLIFPHQQHYAFLFIVPASAHIIHFLLSTENRKNRRMKRSFLVAGLLVVSFLLTSSYLILGVYNNYYQHFKFVTWGALLLIIPLIMTNPLRKEVAVGPIK
jgi:hypothetical protein